MKSAHDKDGRAGSLIHRWRWIDDHVPRSVAGFLALGVTCSTTPGLRPGLFSFGPAGLNSSASLVSRENGGGNVPHGMFPYSRLVAAPSASPGPFDYAQGSGSRCSPSASLGPMGLKSSAPSAVSAVLEKAGPSTRASFASSRRASVGMTIFLRDDNR